MLSIIGEHRLQHGDLADEKSIDELMDGSKADLVYCNPPASDARIKHWDKQNQKDNGTDTVAMHSDHMKLLEAVIKTAKKYSKDWVVIEYEKGKRTNVTQLAQKAGLSYCSQFSAMYKGKYTNDVIIFSVGRKKLIALNDMPNSKEYDLIVGLLDRTGMHKGSKVLDLCCGMETMAKACKSSEIALYGNEINEKRLLKAVKVLEKGTKS